MGTALNSPCQSPSIEVPTSVIKEGVLIEGSSVKSNVFTLPFFGRELVGVGGNTAGFGVDRVGVCELRSGEVDTLEKLEQCSNGDGK